jgi:RNA polymerase sigma-70 factor, ECF subfamily
MAEIPDQFESLYKTHYKMLRSAAANIIRDADASHDVVQEVFIKLYRRKNPLSEIENIKAYLYRSVVNTAFTWLQKNKNKLQFLDVITEDQSRSDSPILMKELELKIENALNNLPPKCKAIFVLSRYEEMKNKEIAETLGLSLKTVENQMGIALKKMREELNPYLNRKLLPGFTGPALYLIAELLNNQEVYQEMF